MKKEHYEQLENTHFLDIEGGLDLIAKLIEVDCASEFLIQEKEINKNLLEMQKCLVGLMKLSEEKDYLVDEILVLEEQKIYVKRNKK
ncbi:MAG: hypothetical protein PHI05_05225 [Bacilli bacterium]|nr:hypothetical protein [Bacilli bacterium]